MSEAKEPVEILQHARQARLHVTPRASRRRASCAAIAEGKLLGQRCPVDGRVYFPTRGSCPQHGVP